QAAAAPQVYARAEGYGGAIGGHIGVAMARAEALPEVEATIGSEGAITAGALHVSAAVDTSGHTAKSWAQSVGAGLLLGFDAALSTATTVSKVNASLGSTLDVSGDVQVFAINHTKESAEVLGVVA